MPKIILPLRRLFLLLIFLASPALSAHASWYAGNQRLNTYGVKAWIDTPAAPPYIESGGQSNWVSLPCCNWVQAGWHYYQGWKAARPYVEYHINGAYGLTEVGTQGWGASTLYQVDACAPSTWCASIAGVRYGSWGPLSTPQQALAMAEIHASSNNALMTHFTSAQYRDAGGTWRLFDQSNWREDFPYRAQKTYRFTFTLSRY